MVRLSGAEPSKAHCKTESFSFYLFLYEPMHLGHTEENDQINPVFPSLDLLSPAALSGSSRPLRASRLPTILAAAAAVIGRDGTR